LNIAPINSTENPARFESSLLQGHPGTVTRDSVEKASAVFRYEVIRLTKPHVHNLS